MPTDARSTGTSCTATGGVVLGAGECFGGSTLPRNGAVGSSRLPGGEIKLLDDTDLLELVPILVEIINVRR